MAQTNSANLIFGPFLLRKTTFIALERLSRNSINHRIVPSHTVMTHEAEDFDQMHFWIVR